MLPLTVVTFSAEDEDQTVACAGDQPATTFVANELVLASVTNGKDPTPLDLDAQPLSNHLGGQLGLWSVSSRGTRKLRTYPTPLDLDSAASFQSFGRSVGTSGL